MALSFPITIPPTLRVVLFDLDGTLIETHIDFPAMTEAMRRRAADAGVPAEVAAGKDILAMVDAAVADVARRNGDSDTYRRLAYAELEALEVAGCANPSLLPGTLDLLTHLHAANIKIGIVTRNCRRVSQFLVSTFALPHNVLMTRDDVRHAKPHPQHLWDTLDALNCKPQDAAMVGDHFMDIQAGRKAGCAFTVGVLGSHAQDWFAPCPPDALVVDLRDLLTLFPACPVLA